MLVNATTRAKLPGPDLLKNRWISQITGFPIDRVIWWDTKEMEVADALSRSGWWREMAADDDDPTVWPTFVAQRTLRKGEGERISKRIVTHCRHERCPYAKRGEHPWEDLIEVLVDKEGKLYTSNQLAEMMRHEKRARVSEKGVTILYGHGKGAQIPRYTKYQGKEILAHDTRPKSVARIKKEGILPMRRRFIQLTPVKTPRRDRRKSVRVKMKPAQLRAAGLTLWETGNPEVILYEGQMPPSILKW